MLIAAAVWAARWATLGEVPPLVLALAASAMAIGTKPTAAILPLAFAPALVTRMASSRGKRTSVAQLLRWSTVALGAGLLLGGAAYLENLIVLHRPIGVIPGSGYGDWKNLWLFPFLVFARPLSSIDASWVPWLHEYWFWPEWDLFFSHYGLPATLALFVLPFAIARYRTSGRSRERLLASLAIVLVFFFALPARTPTPPIGFFQGMARYTFFLPPVIFAWTVAPAIRELASTKVRRWTTAVVAGLAVLYMQTAIQAAVHDAYVPFDFVLAVDEHPELERTVRTWSLRAASWVDQNAGPDDVIAFDASFDGWIYPAFGKEQRRTLVYLHSDRGSVTIPDSAKWVVVDRSWHSVFGNPNFKTMSLTNWRNYIFKGGPAPDDIAVFHQMRQDSRFRMVYRDKTANQAVFVRISMAGGPPT
jgi:hypothetical protein